jgi:hypothetical protein
MAVGLGNPSCVDSVVKAAWVGAKTVRLALALPKVATPISTICAIPPQAEVRSLISESIGMRVVGMPLCIADTLPRGPDTSSRLIGREQAIGVLIEKDMYEFEMRHRGLAQRG